VSATLIILMVSLSMFAPHCSAHVRTQRMHACARLHGSLETYARL
jgi:hypothetical protein